MKVLHLPSSVGGHSINLSRAEKKIGINSQVLYKSSNWLNYDSDINLNLQNENKLYKAYKLISTFLDVRNEYDIFHFNFGSSLIDTKSKHFNLIDLPFYGGKKFMTFNGCDARQKYPTMERVKQAACHQSNCYNGMCNSGLMDKIRRKRITKSSKHVDHIFALNPDLLHFLPIEKSSFLPYSIDTNNLIKPITHNINPKKIKIIHAPTNREAKGSYFILKALEKLKTRYNNIEIQIIENIPNQKAIELYEKADIVIDQVLIGWYGGFGVEVMKMGKPLGVFIREEDLKFIPNQMAKDLKESIININPRNIEEKLSELIENPKLLKHISNSGIQYVKKWHNPTYIANQVKSYYEN